MERPPPPTMMTPPPYDDDCIEDRVIDTLDETRAGCVAGRNLLEKSAEDPSPALLRTVLIAVMQMRAAQALAVRT